MERAICVSCPSRGQEENGLYPPHPPYFPTINVFYAENFLAKVPQRGRLRAIIAELVLVDPV